MLIVRCEVLGPNNITDSNIDESVKFNKIV